MKKRKKRLNKKINPEKSNKMIWAVSLGLLIIFGTLFILITGNDSVKNKEELFENTLSYLKDIEGITGIESDTKSNFVKIFFEPDPNSRSKIDYRRTAVYAGVKLSNKVKDTNIRFSLIKNPDNIIELSFEVLNGKISDSSSSR